MRDALLKFHDGSTVTTAGGANTGTAIAVGPLNQRPLVIDVIYTGAEVGTGEAAGTMTIVVQQSDASAGTYEDISNSNVTAITADADASGQIQFAVYPSKEYVRLSVTVAGTGGTATLDATGGQGMQGTRGWQY